MIDYGVRDISMLVEDLSDQTGKVNAGTKDMLITAVSDMTRRSRAVKLIPFGNDSGNLISFLGAAGSQTAYNVIPQYDIRGSISQLDSSVVREQVGASLAASKWGLGASASVAGSILGIDLSVPQYQRPLSVARRYFLATLLYCSSRALAQTPTRRSRKRALVSTSKSPKMTQPCRRCET